MTEGQQPPRQILTELMKTVQKDFHVSREFLLTKIFVLHGALSFLSLSLCQQMGFKIGSQIDLMPLFMAAGPLGCQALCGAFYLGSSFLILAFALPRHEVTWILKRLPWIGGFFAVSSALLLNFMGDPVAPLYLLVWTMGAWTASLATFSVGRGLKLFVLSR